MFTNSKRERLFVGSTLVVNARFIFDLRGLVTMGYRAPDVTLPS
jgi:hypothetical protein